MARNKGNSLLEFPKNYTVVDLETTGYSTVFDNIIEIGCIKYRNGSEVDRYQTLVKPPRKIPYAIECRKIITNEMVSDAPNFNEVSKDVWNFLQGEIIVGHNVNFDINFLYDNLKQTLGFELSNDFVDTLRLGRKILPNIKTEGYGGHDLDSLCTYFQISIEESSLNRHRAIYDCELANLLLKCLEEYQAENKINLTSERKYQYQNFNELLKNLQSETFEPDDSHIFFEKCCVFTGRLEKFTRIDAAQIVVNIGGYCENSVTRRTNFLIVGDMDYRAGLEGYETSKLHRAKQLIEQGQNLQILPESAFYDLVEDYLGDTNA